MTKERKLAIQMWQEIVDKCRSGEDFIVSQFKDDFCKKYDLDWLSNCYLCQYCRPCSRCPLGSCMLIYPKVCNAHSVSSATMILNALKGINT